ncbi:transposase [Dialister sp.]|uniref:transposase n=1 Tax=Dialister sp. TaxID=1955814 RepID=UPI00406D50D9
MFPSEILNVDDPVLMYDRFMEEIDLKKYLRYIPTRGAGRPRYNPVNMLKTIIYGFAEEGYCSFRKLEDNCRVNISYMYLMNYEAPSYRTFCHFVKGFLKYSLKDIFYSITKEICGKLNVDLQHIYIDGSKFEANANKYSWVWKKSAEKSRYKLFAKITSLFELLNDELKYDHMSVNINTEYAPDYLRLVLDKLKEIWQIDETAFVHGSGHRKSDHQRKYEQLKAYTSKLEEYVEKIQICGTSRNSYSKTDTDATFMRIKSDYMGNDQLLPAYNVQIGVADEFIAVIDVNQYRSDMDCFVPLMEEFHEVYGAYPKYPVADAGYGSFNNYIYCEQHGMEKYMKFPMYKKETKDKKYHTNPFRPGV